MDELRPRPQRRCAVCRRTIPNGEPCWHAVTLDGSDRWSHDRCELEARRG